MVSLLLAAYRGAFQTRCILAVDHDGDDRYNEMYNQSVRSRRDGIAGVPCAKTARGNDGPGIDLQM